MKKTILLLILILGIMNAGIIKDMIKESMHTQYCHDFYQGRQIEFDKCMNE